MPYESFSVDQVRDRFSLTYVQTKDDFASVPPIEPSDVLKAMLERGRPLVVGKSSEKARSEVYVMPVLLEVRYVVGDRITVFSGVKFDVDKKLGLFGYCDFLISRDPLLDAIEAPVVAVTEAKREDLNAGIGQCIAEMVAAQLFNERKKKPVEVVYGAVTDGTRWRFLRLSGTTVTLDGREYGIAELSHIIGILVHMVS